MPESSVVSYFVKVMLDVNLVLSMVLSTGVAVVS